MHDTVTSLIILGTGGNAHDILDIVAALNLRGTHWQVAGFLDDQRHAGSEHLGLPILGRVSEAPRFAGQAQFVNAIGSDRSYRLRPQIIAGLDLDPMHFVTLVHPQASVSPRSRLGRGTYLAAGAVVGGGVTVGDHVHLGSGCLIGHDARIDDYAVIAAGAIVSGGVTVASNCYLGAGASIRQGVRIGQGALVGLGAVVLRDVAPGAVVVGNPARPMVREVAAGGAS